MSRDNRPIDPTPYYQREWITEIYYGNHWYPVRQGTYRSFTTEAGRTYSYEDPFSEETVVINEDVKGFKFRKPEEEEPKASVTQLHKK